MKKGLIITEAFIKALKDFESDDFKDCLLKTYEYAVNGTEPVFENKESNLLFTIFKPFIDSNNAKYEQKQKAQGFYREG